MFDHNIIKVSHGQTIRNKSGELTGIPNGSPLSIRVLKDVLDEQSTLRGGEKKSFGGIYPLEDILKRAKDECDLTYKSSHAMFFDIDELPDVETKKKVFNSFPELVKRIPCLYAMCFSHKGNIHAFMYIQDNYDYEEYWVMEAAWLCRLCRCIEEVSGVRLFPGATQNIDKNEISKAYGKPYEEIPHNLDLHNANMFQQIYLAASPWPEMGYQINEDCQGVTLSEKEIIEELEYYHYISVIHKCNEYYHPHEEDVISKKVKSTGFKVNLSVPTKIKVEGEIDHDMRWKMRNMLVYSLGFERGDRLFKEILLSYDDMRKRTGMERKRGVDEMFRIANGGKKKVLVDRYGKVKCDYETREMMKKLGFSFEESSNEDPYIKSISSNVSKSMLGKDDYLDSRLDYILDEIENNQVVSIKCITGAGKTELVKAISHRKNVAIATPYTGMVSTIYGTKQKGSPYEPVDNIVLYDQSSLQDDVKSKVVSIEDWLIDGGSVAAVWDQCVRMFSKMIKDNYILIVDESHTLCNGTSYRARAIDFCILVDKFIKDGGKVVFVTATPTVEDKEFPGVKFKCLGFDKVNRRRKVDIYYNILNKRKNSKKKEDGEDEYELHRGTAEWRMLGDVVRNYYNHAFTYMFVVSDLYNNIIAEKLKAKGIPFHHLNNSLSEYDKEVKNDMKQVLDEGIKGTLPPGIYLCTCFIENGFNINNIKGSAIILMDYKVGKCSYARIVQTIGRFRKLKNVAAKVYLEGLTDKIRTDGKNVKDSMKVGLNAAEKQLKAESIANTGLEIDYDEDLLRGKSFEVTIGVENEMVGVGTYEVDGFEFTRKAYEEYIRDKFEEVHGQPQTLKKDLEANNIEVELHNMIDEEVENVFSRPKRIVKKEMEAKAWEMLMGREKYDDDYMNLRYPNELRVLYDRLCKEYSKDIIVTFSEKLLEETPENNRSTILKNLEDNLPWSYHNDVWCEEQKHIMEGLIKRMLAKAKDINEKDGVYYDVSLICKEIKAAVKKRLEWRKKYGEVRDASIDIPRIISIMDEDIALSISRRSDSHSVEHKKKKLKVVADGFIGTREEVAKHIGKNVDTVTRWRKNGDIVYVE